jgi:hypothetical protein
MAFQGGTERAVPGQPLSEAPYGVMASLAKRILLKYCICNQLCITEDPS